MKKLLVAVAGVAVVAASIYVFSTIKNSGTTTAESKTTSGLTTCDGQYALCAASTCKPTGKMITGNNGTPYPEVECRCPILEGRAIADTKAGNMAGSCTPTDSQHVWSLFAP